MKTMTNIDVSDVALIFLFFNKTESNEDRTLTILEFNLGYP